MPDYRRDRVPGGTFFFTVNLLERRSHLLVDRIDALREPSRAEKRSALGGLGPFRRMLSLPSLKRFMSSMSQ